jgi:hypothetical protein
MTSPDFVDRLADALPDADVLFPLLDDGPKVVEELVGGRRPHKSALHRWASTGVSGVTLQTITAGRRRCTSRRWLLKFFGAIDAARLCRAAGASTTEHHGRQRRPRTNIEDAETLRRHGLS